VDKLGKKKADKQSYNESDNGYHNCIQWDPLIYSILLRGCGQKERKRINNIDTDQ
jgi:hypothetical protein